MRRDSARANPATKRRGVRLLKGLLLAVLLVTAAAVSAIAGLYVGIVRSLPAFDIPSELRASEVQPTKIFTDSEPPVLVAELRGLERREVLSSKDIPQIMRDAVVAVEDARFYEHHGVDFWGILRALWANIRQGEVVQGGSTITQQLIKNALLSDEKSYERKLTEAVLAYQLENKWSKEKILNEYLNIVYFGEGAYGVGAAARTYFGISASELTLDQAALLAGLLKAPSAYSPRANKNAALERRDLVLNKMYQHGFITSAQLQEALSAPLRLASPGKSEDSELPYWVEMVREELIAKYGASRVLGGGLRVYVSVDLELQKAAEEIIAHVLDQPGDPAAALVCVDVRTGKLLAMVGGLDYAKQQFNLATQARRQPGSAFKPFVLVAALKSGLSPETKYPSGPVTITLPNSVWEVSSTDLGLITLKEATARSSNGVYARLIMDVGAESVAQTAYAMGITTSLGDPPNPAIALGGLKAGVSPLEMAMAYSTLASGGERLASVVTFDPSHVNWPVTISRVVDSEGNVLVENSVSRTRVLDAGLAALATMCLEETISSGTGQAADIGRPAAGKTGTTQNYCDAWFVGYTPELVTAVWVGYPEGQKPMTDVHGKTVTGGTLPAEIWARFMKRALADVPPSDFDLRAAEDWVSLEVCAESGLLPVQNCPTVVSRLFPKGQEPTEHCSLHLPKTVNVPRVVGLAVDEARSLLRSLGFTVDITEDKRSTRPRGTVVGQRPSAGTQAEEGAPVTLIVSAGEESLVTVPNVVGLDRDAAREQLTERGLNCVETWVPDQAPRGEVLAQEPPEGLQVVTGSLVSLTVSAGPEETTTTTSTSPGDSTLTSTGL